MKPDIYGKELGQPPSVINELRSAIRVKNYSIRTEQPDVYWVADFIRFNAMRHPHDLGAREVSAYPSHLATDRDVAASTQQQTLMTRLFRSFPASG